MRTLLLVMLVGCAGPATYRISESEAAPRPHAGEVLASNDPLEAETHVHAADEHVDPVCGMKVTESSAVGSVTRDGKTYFFCSKGCQSSFEKGAK